MAPTAHSPNVLLYEGAIRSVERLIQEHAASHIFLVVDEDAYRFSGADDTLKSLLANLHTTRFCGFQPNPKLVDIQRGVSLFRANPPELVIAIGGGTAIDLGKLIGFIGPQNEASREIVTGNKIGTVDALPMIAIPTTAGTGSEATHFAVAYIGTDKYSVAHPSMLPAHAVIDPRLTHSLPGPITAATGLDAFCQAIESIWAVGATDESIEYASTAVECAYQYLQISVKTPTPESRLAMSRASHLAGKAINISKTTAPHALSYILTSKYKVPHGFAVAMTLSKFLAFNAAIDANECVDSRGHEDVCKRILRIVSLLGATSIAEACRLIDSLAVSIGCPTSLVDLGITRQEQLSEIAASVNVQRMSNNPRKINHSMIVQLLSQDFPADLARL
ncbi:MAG TPA: alcohol dehydrogenase [Planctomycetaceae bacterium]|nr:alcohol dehydrogenase [Planctomycetaceae bacterium]